VSRARLLLLAGLLVVTAAAPRAFAHNLITSATAPSSWGSSISIDDPTVSRVYYGRLDPASPRAWFRFRGKAGDRVYLSTGVPAIERLAGFRPFSALVGPGLPPGDLGFDLPPGAGVQVLAPGGTAREFHEGVTGTDSWIVMEESVTLPGSGEYYFVAYPQEPAEAAAKGWDKLWMAIGTKERFGLADIFRLGSIRRFVRSFHEQVGTPGVTPP
jgi:hypothetical protein